MVRGKWNRVEKDSGAVMGFSLKKVFKGVSKATGQLTGTEYLKGLMGKGGKPPPGYPGASGQEAALREGAGAALAQEAQSLGSIPKAYDAARKQIDVGRTNSIRQAQDIGAQQSAQADQSLASRGLYNTTILDNARQGVAANVSRQISDIEARYGQIRAELGLSQNQAESASRTRIGQIQSGLGGALAGQGNFQQGLALNYAQMRQQWEMSQNPDAWLDSLLGIAGTAIGYSIGGPPGAAAYNEGFGGN